MRLGECILKDNKIYTLYKPLIINGELYGNHSHLNVNAESVSDGHHTMDELYRHRHALFAALIKVYDSYVTPFGSGITCWKSRLHSDGTMYHGWFIAGMSRKKFDGSVEHLSYHLPLDWWDKFNCMEYATAPEYDGYTPEDVLERILKL